MPGSRKYARKKRSYARKAYPSKGKVLRSARSRNPFDMPVSQAAKYAWQGVKYLTGLVNSEMYKFDSQQSGQPATSSGSVIHLTAIAQGDGDGARTGNSIMVRSVNIKGNLIFNTGASKLFQPVRLIVFQDSQQVGDTYPTTTQLLENATTYSHLNSDTVGRFKILHNKVYNLNTGANAGIVYQINLPMQSHVRYNGTAGTDIQKGGLYLLWMSNETVNYPTIDYEARVSYHDN